MVQSSKIECRPFILPVHYIPFLFLCIASVKSQNLACLGSKTVNWREGPGIHHRLTFIFNKALWWPVIVQREKDGWCFVKDYLERTGWVKKKMLNMQRFVLAKHDHTPIYCRPKEGGRVLCFLSKGCLARFLGKNKTDKTWSTIQVFTDGGKKIKGWVRSCHIWPNL